jgi:SAM-dependent methyltransferase
MKKISGKLKNHSLSYYLYYNFRRIILENQTINKISIRYGKLAESDCCLSCGQALGHSNPNPGEICVDLGSGRGNDVLKMAESVGKNGFVYGIDISDGMLKKAIKLAEKFNVNNVKFIKTKLENIPIDTKTIDLVISNCTINHADDKQKVWDEIYRILKTGGRFVVSDIYSMDVVPEEYKNDPQAISECWAGAVTKDNYLKQLERAGFKEITIMEESSPYEKGKIKVASFTILGKKEITCYCKK